MQGSELSAAAPVPMRRGRPRLWFVLLVALAVLIGRGLGWLSGGTKPGSMPGAEQAPQVATGRAENASLPSTARTNDPGAVPAAEGAVPTPAEAPTNTAGASPVDSDRFASLVSLVRTRTDEGQFGSALEALHHMRSLALDATQRTALSVPALELETALAAACSRIVQFVCQGQILAARDGSTRLLDDGEPFVEPVLAESLRPTGLSGGLLRMPAQDGRPWPTAAPLARDRSVRAWLATGVQTGRVIDSRSDEVTLRVQGAQGVTFPTVPIVRCEPVEPTSVEAIEMGFAALHGGDALLARLWLAAAKLRGSVPLPLRAQQLDALLR